MLNIFYQKTQVIMTMLGLYDGACDGVWGPKCIEAKRKWELMDEFEPAVPSNGLPFNGRGKLPKGMNWGYKTLDIIWDKWDQAEADKILAAKGALLTQDIISDHVLGAQPASPVVTPEPVASVNTTQPAPAVSTVLNTVPETEPEPDEDEVVEDTAEQPQQKSNNWTKNRK